MSGRKRELFELMQGGSRPDPGRAEDGGQQGCDAEAGAAFSPSGPASGENASSPERVSSRSLTPRDGLLYLLILGAAVGGAYYLGMLRGAKTYALRLRAQMQLELEEVPNREGVALVPTLAEQRPEAPIWPAEAYVLKLRTHSRSAQGRTLALADQRFLRAQARLGSMGLEPVVLQNDLAYSVCLGAVTRSADSRLEKARRWVVRLSGPATAVEAKPYAGVSVERVRDLGVPLRP